MLHAITDILTYVFILLPLLMIFLVVSGLICLGINFFFPAPQDGPSVISGEVVKTGAGNAMPTKEPPSPLRRRA
jgi:hypothetical protein